MAKRPALGKGIGALLTSASQDGRHKYFVCPVEDLKPHHQQPRKTFNDAKMAELVASIREKGVIQPLVVRHTGDHYQINPKGKLFLGEPSIVAKIVDHASDLSVHSLSLNRSFPLGIVLHVPIAKDLDSIASLFLLGHRPTPRMCVFVGFVRIYFSA